EEKHNGDDPEEPPEEVHAEEPVSVSIAPHHRILLIDLAASDMPREPRRRSEGRIHVAPALQQYETLRIPANLSARSGATWATVPVHLGA
ncbi:MAG: hypothetical protein ABIP89_23710, partial [Polyangiaceae bacterium]